jgi:hypothetical protein
MTYDNSFPMPEDVSFWADFLPGTMTLRLNASIHVESHGADRIGDGFWLELHDSSGDPAGWLHFEFMAFVKGQAIFSVREARSATDPAPSQSVVWKGLGAQMREGCEDVQ